MNFLNIALLVSVMGLAFLVLGALRSLGIVNWRLDQMEAMRPSRIGREGLKIGRNEEARLNGLAAVEIQLSAKWIGGEVRDTVRRKDGDGGRLCHSGSERATQVAVLDKIGARAVPVQLRVEAEEMRTQRRVERTVGDLDGLDGLRLRLEFLPKTKRG